MLDVLEHISIEDADTLKISRKTAYSFFLVAAWVTIFPSEALAYLDPGTGSLIVQSLVAAVAAVGFGIRLHWSRIQRWFKRAEDRADSPSEDPRIERM